LISEEIIMVLVLWVGWLDSFEDGFTFRICISDIISSSSFETNLNFFEAAFSILWLKGTVSSLNLIDFWFSS
jgi:hypothetical protein